MARCRFVCGRRPLPPVLHCRQTAWHRRRARLVPRGDSNHRRDETQGRYAGKCAGFATAKFSSYRDKLRMRLLELGYESDWRVLQAADYGVPQLRPRFILVALPEKRMSYFNWPEPLNRQRTVGDTLQDLMAAGGWKGAGRWVSNAQAIAPTVVGGSKKHGGPDLGPTRARKQWRELGVDGLGIANEPPASDFPMEGHPRLTVRMVARIQGFPDFWKFSGRKTAAYRQVGNAFPPPVASAVGLAIASAFEGKYPAQGSKP
jgi:DNA (cytosine-5)-methyltransferase 1